jgi:hypothetical protein
MSDYPGRKLAPLDRTTAAELDARTKVKIEAAAALDSGQVTVSDHQLDVIDQAAAM